MQPRPPHSHPTFQADLLVTSGEHDTYTATKEQLERWAAMLLPREPAGGAAAGGSGGGDMFGGGQALKDWGGG